MLATTERLLEAGFSDRIITEVDVACIFKGTSARRYALINKAIKKGEIVRLHRGFYVLHEKYRSHHISAFSVANKIVHGSFISSLTALSWHGWIPEKVTVVTSVISRGRSKKFNVPNMGEFTYTKVPTNEYAHLNGVARKVVTIHPFLIASPLRALADYVYVQKIKWADINFLVEGMRIERENLESLTSEDFDELLSVYRSKRTLQFLANLQLALKKKVYFWDIMRPSD